jgi:hypothetical protein
MPIQSCLASLTIGKKTAAVDEKSDAPAARFAYILAKIGAS